MAKFVCAFLLIIAMAFVIQVTYAGGEGSLRPEQCSSECDRRCSQTMYKERCLEFCNLCCAKCLCVPSGFYGHKEECPCYNNWKTKEGKPKCP
ncbi:PREDICTED: gibberellin-regulated protein 12-like [Lupinus angustifolius]|uniref:gibberellin-regulated protein 12-like n=1 Tax=Lupinus angustifolius TaxID=3871 RepID=UPI00092E5AD0|nr:PREDICTED: gibberellin-regulated protein 12-like [Lupinus angustifolius]